MVCVGHFVNFIIENYEKTHVNDKKKNIRIESQSTTKYL